MLPNRWHHGHSLGAGTLLGVVLAGGHLVLLLWVAFLAGAVAALVLVNGRRLVHWLERALARRFPA